MQQLQEISTLDDSLLHDLAVTASEHGVVTVYASVDFANPQAWEVEIRHELHQLLSDRGADHESAELLKATVERAQATLPEVLGSPVRHRSVVGVLAVERSGDNDRWITLEVPTATQATWGEWPQLLPLIAARGRTATTGLVAASEDTLAIWQWNSTGIQDVLRFEHQRATDEWKLKEGHGADAVADAAGRAGVERRIHASSEHFLAGDAPKVVAQLAGALSWERVVAWGPASFRTPLASTTAAWDVIDGGAATLVEDSHKDLVERSHGLIEEWRQARDRDLVTSVTSGERSAATTGRETTGGALAEGRVATLLVGWDPATWTGDLHEELIRQALTTRADVVPVDGEAAALLADCEGVAAILRY